MKQYSPYSSLKIFSHTDHINALLRNERTTPIYIRIKPTNVCNQKCFYCAYADNNIYDQRSTNLREFIPWEVMDGILKDMGKMGVKAVTFSGGGEPLCYPFLSETIEEIKNLDIDYSLISNGQALENDKAEMFYDAKWVRISFDSSNSILYEKTRGVKTYDKVINNLSNFAEKKAKNNVLGINCVVTRENYEEVYDICKISKELGTQNVKLSPIIDSGDYSSYHDSIKDIVIEQIKRGKKELECDSFAIVDSYTENTNILEKEKRCYDRCYIQELFTVIAADCKVYRCHQRAYMSHGEIGDLKTNSFFDIWNDKKVIEAVKNFNPKEYCNGFWCAFDERNILLSDLVNLDSNHINFI